ncbi:molybdenum cofactor cytidylyltransferase [Franzmannia pantelleriensis]|uniref:Molybdenum cofactor cytidylyltransferase n=1 Tax=Franzmannia pantelleriensis TaxID=48727 RepID=A0A1G9GA08_9GAMM|nr:nucleotidyltransferase family protein [Halomonas pantelleriensis]SDK97395.1 molybdenum cofactor cytidylyltransferase [Halomonas pantelleriensis]
MNSKPPPSTPCVAIIMAAGYSRRFGAQDKRRAQLTGEHTLLAATLGNAQRAFPLLRVVLREDDDPQRLGLPATTPIIRAPRAERGLGASIGDAVAALNGDRELDGVVAAAVLLGDMPVISPATLRQLQGQADAATILRPSHAGRPGHPVLFGREVWPELAALDGDQGAREVIRRHRHRYREIAVSDAGVCRDIDSPDELQGWIAEDRR